MMRRLFSRQAREREQRDELLSAYLDGELSAGERQLLEKRLATDSVLLTELEALRHTVALVRDLPQVPISHNFILPQAVATQPRPAPERPRRTWPASLLTAATAIASLLFVAVLSLDLFLPRMGGNLASAPAPEPQMAAEAPREMAVPVEQEVEETVEVPPLAAGAATQAPAQVTAEMEDAGRGEVPAPGEEKVTSPPTGGGMAEEATPTPTAVSPTVLPTGLAVAEAEEEGEYQWDSASEEGTEALPLPDEEGARVARPTSWRAMEIALGLIVLGLALATVRAWRARRR